MGGDSERCYTTNYIKPVAGNFEGGGCSSVRRAVGCRTDVLDRLCPYCVDSTTADGSTFINGGMRVPRIPLKYAIAIEILSLAALVLLTSAAIAETVKVEGGLVKGKVEDGLSVYRGIPYAAPPIGDLRWRHPQPALKWESVRAADQFGRACVQTNDAIAD